MAEDEAIGSATPGGGGDDSNIKVFLRCKPTKKVSGYFNVEQNLVTFDIPKDVTEGFINNSRTNYKFRFDGVIGMDCSQENVFKMVAEPVIRSALDGYNATIFAYGQTGSGKTFTITGGAERYTDRGIIPRTLSFIFNEQKKRTDAQYTVHISYMEIYMENAYDLLNQNNETRKLEDLPKVSMLEDEDGNMHMRNLSMHLASSEEEALNLLFLGDTNRAIGETPMNLASSRSHCIFTISIQGRRAGSDVITRSKLHLVDLAGSERVHKTGAKGQLLSESKFINTSLHYLEMVIVALHEKNTKGRTHIPYRNSMMTAVLRDRESCRLYRSVRHLSRLNYCHSLGGNCRTAMVATISAEKEQTEESISTCRFAQRVSMVKNSAELNEEVDPLQVIRRLKGEIAALREELSFLKGQTPEGAELDNDQKEKLESQLKAYLDDYDPNALPPVGDLTFAKIRECFKVLKRLTLEARSSGGGGGGGRGQNGTGQAVTQDSAATLEELQRLREALAQRDNEIAILVNMIRKGGGTVPNDIQIVPLSPSGQAMKSSHKGGVGGGDSEAFLPPSIPPEVLKDPTKAFELFKQHYPKNNIINDNKRILKEKYNEAKAMGERVNSARAAINEKKKIIEELREKRAVQAAVGGGEDIPSPEEAAQMAEMEKEKKVYKDSFQQLRELKSEIENIQKILEKSRQKLQQDFDSWWQTLSKQLGAEEKPPAPKEAWNNSVPASPTGSMASTAPTVSSSSSRASSNLYSSGSVLSPRGSLASSFPSSPSSSTVSATSSQLRPSVTPRGSYSSSSTTSAGQVEKVLSPRRSSRTSMDGESNSGARERKELSGPSPASDSVDEDISAFYKAKQLLLKRHAQGSNSTGSR